MNNEIIPIGTKIIYHGSNGWENCKCYCGNYNKEDGTYNIYRGLDLCHVPKEKIEIYEWYIYKTRVQMSNKDVNRR